MSQADSKCDMIKIPSSSKAMRAEMFAVLHWQSGIVQKKRSSMNINKQYI
jgi:hypothetical protein